MKRNKKDWKVIIPFTKIIKYFKNRNEPSIQEKIDRELARRKTKCCKHIYEPWEHVKSEDNLCLMCGRSWRGYENN